MENTIKNLTSLAKRRGFVFQSSEIYGGVEALWDYGPLGALLKNNIKQEWLKTFVHKMEHVELLESSILMHPKVWEASGHVENFTDPMLDCRDCKSRFRADHMKEGEYVGQGKAVDHNQCPQCGSKNFTEARQFNLMFETHLGAIQDAEHKTYLRPETAQGMFVDFKFVQETMRKKIPFGIAQIGKVFRNEITTGNYTFRTREFEQMEIEFFVKPGEDEKWFDWWLNRWEQFYLDLGLKPENLRRREHGKDELSHYSKRTVDLEYKFPFGWKEVAGIANRTDYDLKQHSQFSGEDLSYIDPDTKERYIPYVIEPTLGVERLFLALFVDAYTEVKGGRTQTTEATKEVEAVLKLSKKVAPIQIAVLPLVRNKPNVVSKAKEVFNLLKEDFVCQYDEGGSIGRRYRRQDEIGTLFAVTLDFDSLEQNDATIRDRNTMEQERIPIENLSATIKQKLLT